jgi:hypothetical protein
LGRVYSKYDRMAGSINGNHDPTQWMARSYEHRLC